MKKRISALFILMTLISCFIYVKAEPAYDGSIYRFNDYAETVTEEEHRLLNNRINESIEPLKMDFPIFILDKYEYDGELYEYANIVYENNKFGYGDSKDGIFLIINTENGEYNIFFYGKARSVIPKLQKDMLFELTDSLFGDESISVYTSIDLYLTKVFDLAKEWNIDKADKENGMPYWYTDDVDAFENYHAENPVRVVDNAGIFTDEQKLELIEQVQRICNLYDFSYVIFTDDSSYGLSKDVYGADFLYYGGYGKGDDFSAVCFFLCLEEGNRGWRTISTNSYEDIFNADVTYTIDEIVDGDMRSGRYYEAIKKATDYIEKSLSEDNFAIIEPPSNKPNFFGWPLIVGIIIALIIAAMVIEGMKAKMKLHTAVSANEYLEKNSLKIRNNSVRFIYSTVTKSKKRESSSSGGSSHSSGSSSSGGSYSSGGRDF
ncbi:MAG: TPM domain-containing protein [Clostridia bacterium]|nr:TPM domain-containing protein [Clostridia bacterium]